jgi:hypothetical protein
MTGTRIASFVRHNAIALVALFVALGGTGYAAVTINGSSIRNGSIAGKKLKKHTLTGTQINVKKLGTVPAAKKASSATTATNAITAATATNATDLGGHPASSYLTTGCETGTVEGYATVDGDAASFPSTFTSATPFLRRTFNCSGGAVQVRRLGAGIYDIEFVGNPGTVAVGNPLACVTGEPIACLIEPAHIMSVTPITAGPDVGGFQIQTREVDNSYDDTEFDVVVG